MFLFCKQKYTWESIFAEKTFFEGLMFLLLTSVNKTKGATEDKETSVFSNYEDTNRDAKKGDLNNISNISDFKKNIQISSSLQGLKNWYFIFCYD